MQDSPKHLKRLVREWAGIAHERDLRNALRDLRTHFDRWEHGDISAFELNDLIHRYHQETSREIWKRYATNRLEPAVGAAVVDRVIRRDELPPELLQHVARWIEFYEADLSEDQTLDS